MEQLNFYLSAATAYADQASNIFNMFLTVLFSSFGFAAAFPLRDIGKRINIFSWSLSTSSLYIGVTLLAFYSISFITFNDTFNKAEALIVAIQNQGSVEQLSEQALGTFSTFTYQVMGLGLPSIGFIIGSTIGLIIFMWLTNTQREKA